MAPRFKISADEAKRRLINRWHYELARCDDLVWILPLAEMLHPETVRVTRQFDLYRRFSQPRHEEVWKAAWQQAWNEARRRTLIARWKEASCGSIQ
jgi:hypothetical protein